MLDDNFSKAKHAWFEVLSMINQEFVPRRRSVSFYWPSASENVLIVDYSFLEVLSKVSKLTSTRILSYLSQNWAESHIALKAAISVWEILQWVTDFRKFLSMFPILSRVLFAVISKTDFWAPERGFHRERHDETSPNERQKTRGFVHDTWMEIVRWKKKIKSETNMWRPVTADLSCSNRRNAFRYLRRFHFLFDSAKRHRNWSTIDRVCDIWCPSVWCFFITTSAAECPCFIKTGPQLKLRSK